MIKELHLENVLFIKESHLEFRPGLNVITGETGAGKSILLESIKLLLGKKGRSGLVLPGREQARVQAEIDLHGQEGVKLALQELGLLNEDDPERLIIVRTFRATGSDKVMVNGSLTTTSALKQIGVYLMEIHGQNEHQTLLENRVQRRLLDRTGGTAHLKKLEELSDLYKRSREACRHLQEMEAKLSRGTSRLEELQILLKELETLALTSPDEEMNLREEANRFMHVETIASGVAEAKQAFSGEENRQGISQLARIARDQISNAVEHDPGLKPFLERLKSLTIESGDLEQELERFSEHLVYDPVRMALLQDRLGTIGRLCRRHSCDGAGLFALSDALKREIGELTAPDNTLARIRNELLELEKYLKKVAGLVSERRSRLAETLGRQVTKELTTLGFPYARLLVALQPCELGPEGTETVEIQVAFNPGAPAGALRKIASGGELSRVALALKKVLARNDDLPTLIFDEVDTGIGGTTAEKVARCLKDLSAEKQVLLVTHLHQIAKEGEAHFVVGKTVFKGKETRIDIAEVSGTAREEEIARMLGDVSKKGQAFARSLLRGEAEKT